MTVELKLLDNFEEPEYESPQNKALLTDGMTYIEFKLQSDKVLVDKNSYELGVNTDLVEGTDFDVVNSSTNESLPAVIPRLSMPTPIIIRIGIIFRIPEDTVIDNSEIEFTVKNVDSGEIEATQTVIFTEVVSNEPPEDDSEVSHHAQDGSTEI